MKQGTGKSSMSAGKVEPRPVAINPRHVAQIGIKEINTRPVNPHLGRGFSAPAPVGTTHYPKGSQGRSK